MPNNRPIRLEISELCTLIECENSSFTEALKKRFRGFSSQKPPYMAIHITTDDRISPSSWTPSDPSLNLSLENGQLALKGADIHGLFDLASRKGEIKQPAITALFDGFLRILYSYLLTSQNGFMLHAAAIVRRDKGYVFFGPSNSGKSTIASLSSEFTVLGDELIAIRKMSNGYHIFGTPFWDGKNTRLSIEQIQGFFRLHKGPHFSLHKVSSSQAVQEILTNVEFGVKTPSLVESIFTTSCEIMEKAPCYEMHFTPENSLWKNIDEAVGKD